MSGANTAQYGLLQKQIGMEYGMQELIESGMLAVTAVLAAVLLAAGRKEQYSMTVKQTRMLLRIFGASVLLLGLQFFESSIYATAGEAAKWVCLVLYVADYLIIGYDILKKAFKGICNRQVFDENFLMAVATLGALVLAVYETGEYLEVIAVMLFYQVGEWFQSYAVGKSRKNISELMDIRPDYANIEENGRIVSKDPEEIAVGSIIVV